VAHNGLLVNGQGQIKHTAAPHGRIADARFTPGWDYLVGDATAAYGGRLKRFHRHVAFVKGDAPLIVLYDDVAATEPSTFQFMLHALKSFSIDESRALLSVEQPRAGVTVKYLSPLPLAFRQWDGFDPKPDREFPNQWHVEASTREPQEEIGVLTVIAPYRAGRRAEWKAERLETDNAVGVRVTREGAAVLIAFRKADADGPAHWAGQTFDGPVLVK
jgi:hypothetical protein